MNDLNRRYVVRLYAFLLAVSPCTACVRGILHSLLNNPQDRGNSDETDASMEDGMRRVLYHCGSAYPSPDADDYTPSLSAFPGIDPDLYIFESSRWVFVGTI